MSVVEKCQQCGGELARSEVPFGAGAICPRCLLGLGLTDVDQTQAALPRWDSPMGSRFRAPDVDQLIGKFPNLEIQHLIGYGGMGAVYQARQVALDRPVALKILAPGLSQDEAFAQRFTREARTLARLAHPNIVMVFEFGKADPFHYLLMEYVDGINLRDAILEGTLKTSDALTIIPQICDALQYAHDEGVVHRDIKPENILIDRKGRVKIADFGLAKLLQPEAEDLRLTGTQQVLGTLNYMAPEQIEGRKEIDHRADIYSLGVVFYELLTGELPIGRFAAPSEKAGSPHGLDDVVLRTLEKEPDRRYQHASDVKTAIQELPLENQDAMAALPVELVPESTVKPKNNVSLAMMAMAAPQHRADTGVFNRPFGLGNQIRQAPLDLSLPFIIDQVYGGFASAFGILKVTAKSLEFEFEVRDEILKVVRSKSRTVALPLDQIVSVQFSKGLAGDRLEFQTRSIAATEDIPNARSGTFTLKTKKNVRDQVEALVNWLQGSLDPGALRVGLTGQPTFLEKLVTPFRGLLRWQPTNEQVRPLDVSARFSSVRFWFITGGVLQFLLMGGSARQTVHRWSHEMIGELPDALTQRFLWLDIAANPLSEKFLSANSGWMIFTSVIMFTAASKLDQLKALPFVAIASALLLLPNYPLFLLLAPWALWCLLQLMRPSTIAVFGDCQSCDTETGKPGEDLKERIPVTGQTFISRYLTVTLLLTLGLAISSLMLTAAVSKGPIRLRSLADDKDRPTASVSVSDSDVKTEPPTAVESGSHNSEDASQDDSDGTSDGHGKRKRSGHNDDSDDH